MPEGHGITSGIDRVWQAIRWGLHRRKAAERVYPGKGEGLRQSFPWYQRHLATGFCATDSHNGRTFRVLNIIDDFNLRSFFRIEPILQHWKRNLVIKNSLVD